MNAPLYSPTDVAFRKKPEKEQKYYFITANAVVSFYLWDNECIDNDLYDVGNFFLEESDAERAAAAIRAYLKDGTFTSTVSVSCPDDEVHSSYTVPTAEERTTLHQFKQEDLLSMIRNVISLISLIAIFSGGIFLIALWSIV